MTERPLSNDPAVARAVVRLVGDQPLPEDLQLLSGLLRSRSAELLELLGRNVVGVRTLEALQASGESLGEAAGRWLEEERSRVRQGLAVIEHLTGLFERRGVPFLVIKTGDHYPDQGHDVDLFLGEGGGRLEELARRELGAVRQDRSLSEVLAAKTNLRIEAVTVEAHRGRLGQLGEHRRLAQEVFDRRRQAAIGPVETWIPSLEGRLFLALLQRVYRHFNFRLCDIVNLTAILGNEAFDRERFWRVCRQSGIAHGAGLGIGMVAELLRRIGLEPPLMAGDPVPDPPAARLIYRRGFYRFSLGRVVPGAYARQLARSLRPGSGVGSARLLLLFPLMAVVGLNIRFLPAVPIWRKLW